MHYERVANGAIDSRACIPIVRCPRQTIAKVAPPQVWRFGLRLFVASNMPEREYAITILVAP